jgi:hypothetical protein
MGCENVTRATVIAALVLLILLLAAAGWTIDAIRAGRCALWPERT